MNPQFDNLKIIFPSVYSTKNEERFHKDKDNKGNECFKLNTNEKVVGINSLWISKATTAVEITAKVLKGNYPLLLSAETIEEALTNVLGADLIRFDVHEVLNISHVLKAHPAKHLRLQHPFACYADLIKKLHTNTHYTAKNYFDETIEFIQNVDAKQNREYWKMYAKGPEYQLSKNAGYRETLTVRQKPIVAQYFEDIIKSETELNSLRKLRQHYPDIPPEIKLTDLLLSNSDPISKQFEEITKRIYKQMENEQIEKEVDFVSCLEYKDQLIFNTLEKFDYDLDRVKAWLKRERENKVKPVSERTFYRLQDEYENILQRFKAHQTDGKAKELLTELKAAICAPTSIPYNYSSPLPKMAPLTAAAKETDVTKELAKLGYTHEKIKADDEFWEMMSASTEPIEELPW